MTDFDELIKHIEIALFKTFADFVGPFKWKQMEKNFWNEFKKRMNEFKKKMDKIDWEAK